MKIRAGAIAAALCAAVATMTGCATATPVPLPDGQRGFVIGDCDDPAECYKKAAETCEGKYAVLNESNGSIGSVSSAGGMVGMVMISQYTMTIRCDSAGATAAQAKSAAP